MELCSSNITKILMFSQKKAFLVFPEMKPPVLPNPGLEKQEKNPL